MLDFPVPYSDELVFSLIARAGVHMGITSPKQLLDEVFSNRKVIATVDLPCHLFELTEQYPDVIKITLEQLIYQHTLFPIYAPFVSEERRQHCLKWMSNESKGAIHLSLGVSASRVKQIKTLRYCPGCLKKQFEQYGEYYWMRRWQIAGADCCLKHGMLLESAIGLHNYHRHNFEAANPQFFENKNQLKADNSSERITRQVIELLSPTPKKSPAFWQWSAYYKDLVKKNNCNRGEQINYDAVKDRIKSHWSEKWLNSYELEITDDQSCWLRGIFRKHRKSFSYLEHIVVLDSFLDSDWQIENVIKSVANQKKQKKVKPIVKPIEVDSQHKMYREQWEKYLLKYGTKKARSLGGAAVYAWLYRHDRVWLQKINELHRIKMVSVNKRVNWCHRDWHIVRKLFRIKYASEEDIYSPRRSRNWYLSELEQSSTIEHNLDKLKLTNSFFDRYSEDIHEYQIRRINRAIQYLKQEALPVRRWRILRLAGLSEERLKVEAREFLRQGITD